MGVWYGRSTASSDITELHHGPFRAVWFVPDAEAQDVYVEIIFQTGEADATGPEGIAHYVEHLSWINANQVDAVQEQRHSNAWTTALATGYTAQTDPIAFAQDLKRLLAVTTELRVDPDFAREERDIVMREYDLNFRDDAYLPIYEEIYKVLYGGMPLSRSVIGSPKTIGQFTLEMAEDLRQQTHRLENAVLFVSGNMSADDVNRVVSRLELPEAKATEPAFPTVAPEIPLDDRQIVFATTTTPVTLIDESVFPRPDCGEPVDCVVRIRLINDVMLSSRAGSLVKPLRFDTFIARNVAFHLDTLGPDHMSLSFYSQPDDGVPLDDLLVAYETTLAQIIADGIPDDTFEKVHAALTTALATTDDLPGWILSDAVDQVIVRAQPYSFAHLKAAVARVTVDDLNLILAGIGRNDRRVVRFVHPLE